jgi:large subunit ribosomal protein L6
MSRIGKRPIAIPNKVTVQINGQNVAVKGPKGSLERDLPSLVEIKQDGDNLTVVTTNSSRTARERHGLSRTLVANMIEGVSQGFEKKLELKGVGYRAQAQGTTLTLNVGYSKPVEITMPNEVQVAVEKNTLVTISGINKEVVGNTAAKIRAVRPPEPYKGKGIHYLGEVIRRKAGKTGKK